MRDYGDILLVSTYELGHQPLSLASPVAVLEDAGYAPVAVDTSVETLTDGTIRQARFIGISVPMHTAMRLGVHVGQRICALNPEAHVCFYGLYATLNADYLLQNYADSVVSGEYEQKLLELVQALDQTAPANGSTAGNLGPNITKIPFTVPNREQLPALDEYARLMHDGEISLAGYTETSRGCLHTCRHCPITPIYDGRFFVIPRDVVMEDIRRQVDAGARHITFGDPDFMNGPGHSMTIVRQMRDGFPDVTFDATIKIEHILEFRDRIMELGELGCAFIVSAVEATSDTVLEKLKKGHTRADIETALAITREAGIPLRPSFVAFTPWTTLDDYLDMLTFVEEHRIIRHVDPVQYSIRLLIPPNSAILDLPDTDEWISDLDAASYTYRWDHPDPRMDALHSQISAIVEAAARADEDAVATFYRIKQAAWSSAGRTLDLLQPADWPELAPVPALTEDWFC